MLDFLGLAEGYSERDLEAALVREMERLLLELGQGFAFVERQKRMVIDGRDFHLGRSSITAGCGAWLPST